MENSASSRSNWNWSAAARRSPPSEWRPTIWQPRRAAGGNQSFVLREGTDYGVHETSLEDKVAQVLIQLRRGEADITFDPATESVNVVVTSAIDDRGGPSVGACDQREHGGRLGTCPSDPFSVG